MHLIGQLGWIYAAWRWGDWRNWKKYQATILYLLCLDFLYNFLTYDYPLWKFSDFFLPTHTLNSLAVTLIGFPCSMLIYLGRYPEDSMAKKIIHTLLWIILFSSVELFYVLIGLFHYYHGWNFGWSVLFNCVEFLMLRLHYKRPLLTYLISVLSVIALMVLFKIPITK